jgi:glycosyltransferase involved in cell wall biosynthesis
MRLALCLGAFDPSRGGEAIWTRGFACFLRDQGHEVHVVTEVAADPPRHITTHLVKPTLSPLLRARRMARTLRGIAPDAVHDAASTIWPGVCHPHAGSRWLSQRRLIATEPPARRLRAALSPKTRWLLAEMAWLEARQARVSRALIAVSPLVGELLAARHPASSDKIVVAMNGVDTERFRPSRDPRPGPVRFLFAAHNPRLKGLNAISRALARMVDDGMDVHLSVAGAPAGPEWSAPPALAGRVAFLGLVADMAPIYAASDVLVHPTRSDACSLVVLEAMASGLPVITTARDGASAAIVSGESGIVLPAPDDPATLLGAMRRLCDPAERRRIGQAARASVEPMTLARNHQAVEAILLRSATPGGG